MGSVSDKEFWESHDRKLAEHENKISDVKRDYSEIRHEIRQLMERINMGISPTQNKILEKQSDIEMSLTQMDHKMELKLIGMEEKINTVAEGINLKIESFHENEIMPVKSDIEILKKTLIYGVVTGAIGVLITLGGKTAWDKMFNQNEGNRETRISQLKAVPMRR